MAVTFVKFRYCFRKDESGHDYLIPAAMAAEFDAAVAAEDHDKLNDMFNDYRCVYPPSSYTFESPMGPEGE